MTDVDLWICSRELEIVLIGAEGSYGVAAQGKECFLCSTNRIWQKPYLSDVCSCKSSSRSAQRPSVIVISPSYKREIGRKHTTFTSRKTAACSNECFPCRLSRLFFGGKRFDWANVNFGCLLNIFHTERSWHAYWFSLVGMICPLMQEHFLSWPLSKSKALYCGWLRVLGCFISPECLLDLNNFKRFSLCPWMWLFAAMFCHAKAHSSLAFLAGF